MRRLLALASVLLLAATMTSCATIRRQEGRFDPVPVSDTAIWKRGSESKPLPILELIPGEQRRINLRGATASPIKSLDSWKVSGDASQDTTIRAIDAETLLLTVGPNAKGTAVARGGVRTADGKETLAFGLVVSPRATIEFSYTPPAGKAPTSVVVAGDFNGWNNAKDRLEKDADGVFRGSLALDPGSYTYKFVVDGDWIADPGNPKQDSSGYGNSLLEVAGDKEERFEFLTLSTQMPGAGGQAAFKARIPGKGELESAHVFLNSRELKPDEFEIDGAKGMLVLAAKPWKWGAENFVSILARDSSGRIATHSAWLTYRNAPRSPRDEIIYYALTDRFHDGNPALNNPASHPELHPLANYHGGDFAGLSERIAEGYFEKLGITTLWISPVNKNTPNVERDAIPPHRLFTGYHGYWPTSLTETNEQFGSLADLRALVDAAHAGGMAVLFDLVVNHVHEDHPLLAEHPDWITDLKTPDGRDNIRLFDDYPFTTWFDTFLPTLNFENNEALTAAMVENGIWWIEETGADGFRLDAVKHVPNSFWRALHDALHREITVKQGREVFTLGETISGRGTINEFISPDLLDGQFDFPLYFALRPVLANNQGSMATLLSALQQSLKEYPAYAVMSPMIGNHDVIRFMGYADGDIPEGMDEKEIGFKMPPRVDSVESYDRIRLAMAFLLTIPGAPMIYYGDEIGLTGAHDPDNRRSMPWEWDEDQQETFTATAALANARNASVALRRGNFQQLVTSDERIGYARVSPEEVVVVMLTRKPTNDLSVLVLPDYWGTPRSITPLAVSGMNATLVGRRLELRDEAYGYGVWRVEF